MTLSKWNDRLQLIASLGVIIGLLLVAWEIRHAMEATQSDAGVAANEGFMALGAIEVDPAFAALWIKSEDGMAGLSRAEQYRLDGYLWMVWAHYEGLWLNLDNLGMERISGWNDPNDIGRTLSEGYLYTEFGRQWFEANKSNMLPPLVEAVEQHMSPPGP